MGCRCCCYSGGDSFETILPYTHDSVITKDAQGGFLSISLKPREQPCQRPQKADASIRAHTGVLWHLRSICESFSISEDVATRALGATAAVFFSFSNVTVIQSRGRSGSGFVKLSFSLFLSQRRLDCNGKSEAVLLDGANYHKLYRREIFFNLHWWNEVSKIKG